MRCVRTTLVSVVLVAVTGTPLAAHADTTWTQVAAGSTGGISGLAPAASGWVIVRDNKKSGQNRIALLDDLGNVTPLVWPGSNPSDLEAVAAVPGSGGAFAALASTGTGTILTIDGTDVSVVRTFTVPRGTRNIESFALTSVGTTTLAVWATRGSTTAAATVFAATFHPATGSFGRVTTGSVRVPFPTSSVRQLADLTVVGDELVGSSTSDPGASGPFASALYRLGSVSLTSGRALLRLMPPVQLGVYPGHKIEGVGCSGTTGLLGSDDEKQGGWTSIASICG
jgi:hypothetical protein